MRVLFLSPVFWGSKDISGVSVLNYIRDITSYSRHKWIFALPSQESGYIYDDKYYTDHNIELIKYKIDGNVKNTDDFVAPSLDAILEQKHLFFDVVWNRFFFRTPHFFKIINRDTTYKIKFLTQIDEFPMDIKLFGHDENLFYMVASVIYGKTIFLNTEHFEKTKNIIKRFFSYSVLQKFLENTKTIFPSVETELYKREKKKSITLFHGGTLQGKRRIGDIIDLYRLAKAKFDVKLLLVTQNKSASKLKDYLDGSEEVVVNANRNRYLEELKRGDILICLVEEESTGISYLEAIMSGMNFIFLSATWINERISDKRVIGKNLTEVKEILFYALNNYEEYSLICKNIREEMKQLLSPIKIAKQMDDVIDEAKPFIANSSIIKKVKQIPKNLSTVEFFNKLKDNTGVDYYNSIFTDPRYVDLAYNNQ